MNYDAYGPFMPVIMLLTFLALFAWVLHPKNSKRFSEAAMLPFENSPHTDGQAPENRRSDK